MKLRRLRSHFGIAAPRVAIRTQVPWHWRIAAIAGALIVLAVFTGWAYDAGRRLGGLNPASAQEEIARLQEQVSKLEEETARLRAVANSSESNLEIERTTRDQLSRQVKALEEENTKLKVSLAVFENLASGGAKAETISLTRLHVEPDGAGGRYRYRLLASRQGEQAEKDFHGNLQLYLTVQREGGDSAMIILPGVGDPDAARFAVTFRNFRTLEGHFQIPADAKIKRFEVRLVQGNAVKASQSVTL